MATPGKLHRYKVGQRVNYAAGPSRNQFTSARYTVTRVLPRVGNTLSYRIKGDDEAYERVVEEATLEAAF